MRTPRTSVAFRAIARREYRLADGTVATGWAPANPLWRLAAWVLDVGLFIATVGVGWSIWAWRQWDAGTTPGKSSLGITVFDIASRRPARRRQMIVRALVYQPLAMLIGAATLGLAWVYCLAAVTGAARRTVYDEWARVIVLRHAASGTAHREPSRHRGRRSR